MKLQKLAIITCFWMTFCDNNRLGEANSSDTQLAVSTTNTQHPYCVAIVTRYPEVYDRQQYVNRIVQQLTAIQERGDHWFHVHIFCLGECKYFTHFVSERVHLHYLSNIEQKSSIDVTIAESLLDVVFGKHDMFRDTPKRSCGKEHCEFCVIVEDDIIFASDALHYFEKGMDLMNTDKTILAVSALNENALPWLASDNKFFKRTSHFPATGFVLSRKNYELCVFNHWYPHTDNVMQEMFQKIIQDNDQLVCIVPEVNRVMRVERLEIQHLNDLFQPRSKLESLVFERTGVDDIDLTHVTAERHDAELTVHIHNSIEIEHIHEAGFYGQYATWYNPLIVVVNSTEKLRSALADAGIQSASPGGRISGVYKDIIHLRPYGVSLLLASRTSSLMQGYQGTQARVMRYMTSHHQCDSRFPQVEKMMLRTDFLEKWKGSIYWLLTSSFTFIAEKSCEEACAERNAKCSLMALWIINQDCDIMKGVFPRCDSGSCYRHSSVSEHGEWDSGYVSYLPAVDYSFSPPVCKQQNPIYLNCHAQPAGARRGRLCACVTG